MLFNPVKNRVPSLIVNGFSTTGVVAQNMGGVSNAKLVLSGALTAGVLATVLSVAGGGELNLVAATSVDATSRTVRLKITLDGVVVFDSTTAAVAVAGNGLVAVGLGGSATGSQIWDSQKVAFNSSCLVEVASSLTETNKVQAHLNYVVF